MRISIISVSCCNPTMRLEDQRYLAKVREALVRTELEAHVRIVTIGEATSALSGGAVNNLMRKFERYGPAMLPVMLIDDEPVLYGGVPTTEKICETIKVYEGAIEGVGSSKKTRTMESTEGEGKSGLGSNCSVKSNQEQHGSGPIHVPDPQDRDEPDARTARIEYQDTPTGVRR